MKGNDGRGARNVLARKIALILVCFFVFLFILTMLGFGKSHYEHFLHHEDDHRSNRGSFRKRNFWGSKSSQKVFDADLNDPEERDMLLSGSFNLIEIHSDIEPLVNAPSDSYAGVTGRFCQLNFGVQKKDPSSVPMFRHLVDASPGCSRGPVYSVDLKELADLARNHDESVKRQGERNIPKALNVSGVVFHESRCGSTLVANSLMAMNPTQHRVYSESAPPIAALRVVCGEDYHFCTLKQAAQLLRDVVYLMSRTDDPKEERVFFKIQSIGTRSIQVFQEAFPHTPWIFVYREPVQVMMSQLEQGTKHANCVRSRQASVPTKVSDILLGKGTNAHAVSDVMYCAAHLASITESAVKALERGMGRAVNYAELPNILYEHVIPHHFGVPVDQDEIDRIVKISSVYSKGTAGRQGAFQGDSERKERMASAEMRTASKTYLEDSFNRLESFRKENNR